MSSSSAMTSSPTPPVFVPSCRTVPEDLPDLVRDRIDETQAFFLSALWANNEVFLNKKMKMMAGAISTMYKKMSTPTKLRSEPNEPCNKLPACANKQIAQTAETITSCKRIVRLVFDRCQKCQNTYSDQGLVTLRVTGPSGHLSGLVHHLNDTTSVNAKCNCQAQTNQREDNFVRNGYLLSVRQFLSGRRWAVDDTIVRQVVEQRGQHDERSA